MTELYESSAVFLDDVTVLSVSRVNVMRQRTAKIVISDEPPTIGLLCFFVFIRSRPPANRLQVQKGALVREKPER